MTSVVHMFRLFLSTESADVDHPLSRFARPCIRGVSTTEVEMVALNETHAPPPPLLILLLLARFQGKRLQKKAMHLGSAED